MENKEIYLRALIKADGKYQEVDLGSKLGFDEEETYKIISQLMAEYKLEYIENRSCNYSLKKKAVRNKN